MTITTMDDYREAVDGAPIELIEAAERAYHLRDDLELQLAASDFVHAKDAFEAALEEREIELG